MSPKSKLRPSLVTALVAVLAVGMAVLLYRDYAREASARSEEAARGAIFDQIYARGSWARDAQGKGTSGTGSSMEFTRLYRVFLQDFLAAHRIRSVVDAGCGDWEFSQAIDWTGIDYLGLDIVPSIIEADRRKFGTAKIRFAVADIVRDQLPPADLLVVKDVLQHLSNADIARFLANLPRYRHVLIVNDVNPASLTAVPDDVPTGGYRQIDLTLPPHSLPAAKVLAWRHGRYAKLVLHLRRSDDDAPAGGETPPPSRK